MNDQFFKEMFGLSNKLNNYYFALMLKCEICGPVLRGADKSRYPECKRHKEFKQT